jgi:hypothetical protein
MKTEKFDKTPSSDCRIISNGLLFRFAGHWIVEQSAAAFLYTLTLTPSRPL